MSCPGRAPAAQSISSCFEACCALGQSDLSSLRQAASLHSLLVAVLWIFRQAFVVDVDRLHLLAQQ